MLKGYEKIQYKNDMPMLRSNAGTVAPLVFPARHSARTSGSRILLGEHASAGWVQGEAG